MTNSYDIIVIGGSINGLVAAAYLGRAGRKVCVLERRQVLGGCASTEELWPGFRVSPAAYVISLLLPEIVRQLRLDRHGLKILLRDPSEPLRFRILTLFLVGLFALAGILAGWDLLRGTPGAAGSTPTGAV